MHSFMFFRYLFVLISLFYFKQSTAQSEKYILKKRVFTYADGLPNLDVTCGVADKYGFLWFGTRNGLCRYDGNKFVLFSKKKYNFRGNKIANLTYDGEEGIIISYEKLFDRFNAENKPNPETDVININTLSVTSLTSYFKELPFKEADCFSIRNTPNNKIIFRNVGEYQEWNYSKKNGFKKQVTQNDTALFLQFNKKNIEHYFDKKTATNYYQDNYSTTSLSERVTAQKSFNAGERAILFKKNQEINFSKNDYAGTAVVNDTIKLFHPTYGTISILNNNGKEKFINIHINSFFKDNEQNYWLCTNEGLVQLTIKEKKFINFFTKEDNWIIGNNAARGIYVDKEVCYANLYDYSVLKTDKGITLFKGGANFAVAKIDNYFWSTNYNIRRFNLKSLQMEFLFHSQNGEIWSIYNLNDSSILLGCVNGVLLYNKKRNSVNSINVAVFPKPIFVYKIFKNNLNEIILVANNGLYVCNENGKAVDFFSIEAKTKIKQFPFENIYDVYQDKKGIYWIGTNNDGLFRWDKDKHSFKQFDIESGFISNTINSIQEDNFNNLWLGTDYGLVQFSTQNFSSKIFTTKDGIANNEFNRSSSFKDANGILYFGGMNGVTSFNPANFLKANRISTSPLSIINFSLFNKQKNIFEDKTPFLLLNNQIELNEQYQFFTLSFSLMDYEERIHNYAYKMEGLDSNWVYTIENNIKIGNLPYGNYKLRIKAQAEDGSWSGNEINIPLYVMMPIYKKWWFYMLLFSVAIIIIFVVFKQRNYLLKKKNEKLATIIKNRTKDLELALAEQLSLTQEIHHRVKNNLQFMTAIIEMQINATDNYSNKSVLKDTSRRINAMNLVHQMLYNTEKIEKIAVGEYLKELIERINEIVNDNFMKIEFDILVDEVNFNISDCVSIGMITSELVSNSIKYAFKNVRHPRISIHLNYNAHTQQVIYKVKDNGVGFEKTDNAGLGLRLIDIFIRQLNGTYTINTQQQTLFTFQFTAK